MLDRLYIRSLRIEDSRFADEYLLSIPAITCLLNKELEFSSPLVFFAGENGSGKSTLLEAIAISAGFNPEGGGRNFSFFSKNSHSDLHQHLLISRQAHFRNGFFLRAESFYNLATNIDELDKEGGGPPLLAYYGGVSLHEQSHGESFMALIRNRFGSKGLYLLDEPEAALSPNRQMQLLLLLHDLLKEDCQFIIATHSPILLSYPAAQLLNFSETGIEEITYEQSGSYLITRDFIERPKQMYHYLFEEDEK